MVDYVGTPNLWNPVLHLSAKGHAGFHRQCWCSECIADWNGGDQIHWNPEPVPPPVDVKPSDLFSMVPVLHRSVEVSISKSVLERATQQMPEVVSVGNFLLELREGVKGILPAVTNLKSCLGNLYLGWKFGIESFLSDLKKLTTVWTRWQRRLNYLRRHNGVETWVRGYRDSKHGSALTFEDFDIPPDIIVLDQGELPSGIVS